MTSSSANAATITVCYDCNYTKINEAINNANDGDTVEVQSGIYYENVLVTKYITLRGIGRPVIDAGGKYSSIKVRADKAQTNGETIIEGFELRNSGSVWSDAGIEIWSPRTTIQNNIITFNHNDGIILYSVDNKIIGNTISFVYDAIDIGFDKYQVEDTNIIKNNIIIEKPTPILTPTQTLTPIPTATPTPTPTPTQTPAPTVSQTSTPTPNITSQLKPAVKDAKEPLNAIKGLQNQQESRISTIIKFILDWLKSIF